MYYIPAEEALPLCIYFNNVWKTLEGSILIFHLEKGDRDALVKIFDGKSSERFEVEKDWLCVMLQYLCLNFVDSKVMQKNQTINCKTINLSFEVPVAVSFCASFSHCFRLSWVRWFGKVRSYHPWTWVNSHSWASVSNGSQNVKATPLANTASHLCLRRRWNCRDFWKQEGWSPKKCPINGALRAVPAMSQFPASLHSLCHKPGGNSY